MMNKKILIHCSTNSGTSNFGDVIFAEMILNHLQDAGYEAGFFELSDYVDDYLYKTKKFERHIISMDSADGVVYFAGGYFGEKKSERIDRSIRHYKRFMRFGKLALNANKPIAVIGIGAGPYLWFPSKSIVKKVCNCASVISTRDPESTSYLKGIGVSNQIETCSDLAQTYLLPNDYTSNNSLFNDNCDYIFLHTNYQIDVATLFANGVKDLVLNNPNIKVIVGADNVVNIDNAAEIVKRILGDNRVVVYNYSIPDDLCAVISKCDLIITYKLHVGILASTLGRSVISVYKHPKIVRYYNQIKQIERCVDFNKCSVNTLSNLVNSFYGKTFNIPIDVLNSSKRNWDLLDAFVSSL